MTPPHAFSNDRPLTNRGEDRLNRAAFADRIAEVLCDLPSGPGLTVGIYGAWGDGKTTVLNLLRANLANKEAVVVRDFNPWRLSNDDAIFRGFFSILTQAIGESLSTKAEHAKARANWWAKRLRWITKPGGAISKSIETADGLIARFAEVALENNSGQLEELRDRMVALLNGSAKRVVILIDDIDRLDKQETHTLFRLIKACADFPKVSYVLAFDDSIVSKAIGERYGGGDESAGRAFLEKIIQVPLQLPVAAREDLRSMCFEQVDRVLSVAGIELTRDEVGEFVASFEHGVSIRVSTPRAVNRFANGLMFALPSLAGETNPVDHLLVEALRAFYPNIYEIIRENHSDFSGIADDLSRHEGEKPRGAQLLRPLLEDMPRDHADSVKALITDLFPRLSGVYENPHYGADWLGRWSAEKRISAPEYCPRYFTYAVPHNDVPDAEVVAILEMARNADNRAIEARLTSQLDGSRAGRFIEKLRAAEKTVDPETAEGLAVPLSKMGRAIPNPDALFTFAEPPTQAAILISNLLKRIGDRSHRSAVARRVLESAEPLWFGVECLRWMRVTDKPEKEDSNTVTGEEAGELHRILVGRIKSQAADGAPLFDPDVPQEDGLLFEWRRAEGPEPVQAHLERVFTTDPGQISRFLLSQTPRTWTGGSATSHVGDLGAERVKNIGFIIDVDLLADLVRQHCDGDFDEPRWYSDSDRPVEQRLAEQFMYVLRERKKGTMTVD